jgi:hypothetical protein
MGLNLIRALTASIGSRVSPTKVLAEDADYRWFPLERGGQAKERQREAIVNFV